MLISGEKVGQGNQRPQAKAHRPNQPGALRFSISFMPGFQRSTSASAVVTAFSGIEPDSILRTFPCVIPFVPVFYLSVPAGLYFILYDCRIRWPGIGVALSSLYISSNKGGGPLVKLRTARFGLKLQDGR
jgi:hypothetical protein